MAKITATCVAQLRRAPRLVLSKAVFDRYVLDLDKVIKQGSALYDVGHTGKRLGRRPATRRPGSERERYFTTYRLPAKALRWSFPVKGQKAQMPSFHDLVFAVSLCSREAGRKSSDFCWYRHLGDPPIVCALVPV